MPHKLKKGDCVKFNLKGYKEPSYGYIRSYSAKKSLYTVYVSDSHYEDILLSEKELTYMPPVTFNEDMLKKFIRFECSEEELIGGAEPIWNWRYEDTYTLSLEDMVVAVKNLKKKNPEYKEFYKWFEFYSECLEEIVFLDYDNLTDNLTEESSGIPQTNADMAMLIYDCFNEFMYSDIEYTGNFIDYDRILADIDNFKAKKQVEWSFWSDAAKFNLIDSYKDKEFDHFSEAELAEIKNTLNEMVEKGYWFAIKKIAYFYYGGNRLFPCDWVKSRDYFLKLMEMDNIDDLEKCYFANTLGYIYYYGRCTNGVPDYENAMKYFTIGAAGGIYESIYKLSDMFVHGYGTAINKRAASTLVDFVYNDTIKGFLKGDFESKFADAALRKGNLCRDGIANGYAYYYYTVADFAIRKRLGYGHYGDASVFGGIQAELAKIRENEPLVEPKNVEFFKVYPIIRSMFKKHSCEVKVKEAKSGLKLEIAILQNMSDDNAEYVIECYPEYGYCIASLSVISFNLFNAVEIFSDFCAGGAAD